MLETWALRFVALGAVALLGCSSDGGSSGQPPTPADSGAPAADCNALCDRVSSATCPASDPVQSRDGCAAECSARQNAGARCTTEFGLFASCCQEGNLSSECMSGLSFADCEDLCKQEGDTLQGCESGTEPTHPIAAADPRCVALCSKRQGANCPQEQVSGARCARLCNYQLAVARDHGCASQADTWLSCITGGSVTCGPLGAVVGGCDTEQQQLVTCISP